jgi:hypothetical protein
MSKPTLSFLRHSLPVFLSLVAFPSPSLGQEEDNPDYLRWNGFPVGTAIVHELTNETLGLTAVITTQLAALTEVEARVETTMTVTVRGKRYERPKTPRTIPSKVKAADGWAPAAETGRETLEAAGEAFECQWSKSTLALAGHETTTKVWMSDRVPGGLVRLESTTTGTTPLVMSQRLISVTRP